MPPKSKLNKNQISDLPVSRFIPNDNTPIVVNGVIVSANDIITSNIISPPGKRLAVNNEYEIPPLESKIQIDQNLACAKTPSPQNTIPLASENFNKIDTSATPNFVKGIFSPQKINSPDGESIKRISSSIPVSRSSNPINIRSSNRSIENSPIKITNSPNQRSNSPIQRINSPIQRLSSPLEKGINIKFHTPRPPSGQPLMVPTPRSAQYSVPNTPSGSVFQNSGQPKMTPRENLHSSPTENSQSIPIAVRINSPINSPRYKVTIPQSPLALSPQAKLNIPIRAPFKLAMPPVEIPSQNITVGIKGGCAKKASSPLKQKINCQTQNSNVNAKGTKERPNYKNMNVDEQNNYRADFLNKFNVLRSYYPQSNIENPPEYYTIDQIHDLYECHVNRIMVTLSCNEYKVYLVITLLAMEVFFINVLKLDVQGFTLSQISKMSSYERLLIELGERNLIEKNSTWPIEIRILFVCGFNMLMFLAVKFFSNSIGGPQFELQVQNAIDGLTNMNLGSSSISRDNCGIPIVPGTTQQESSQKEGGGAGGFDLSGIINGFMGGNSDMDIPSMIGKIGSIFTAGKTGNKSSNKSDGPKKPPVSRKPCF